MKSLFNESHSRFINLAIHNPTQLDARRFKKLPSSKLESRFTDSKAEFKDFWKKRVSGSRFDDLLGNIK